MCSSTSIHYEANILFHKCTRTRANSRKEWHTLRDHTVWCGLSPVLDGQIYWFCNQTRCRGLFFAARPLSFSVTAIQIQCVLCNIAAAAAIAAPWYFLAPSVRAGSRVAGRSFILLKGRLGEMYFRRQTNAYGKMVAERSSRRLHRRPELVPQRETKSALRAEAGKGGSACNVHLPGLE